MATSMLRWTFTTANKSSSWAPSSPLLHQMYPRYPPAEAENLGEMVKVILLLTRPLKMSFRGGWWRGYPREEGIIISSCSHKVLLPRKGAKQEKCAVAEEVKNSDTTTTLFGIKCYFYHLLALVIQVVDFESWEVLLCQYLRINS